MERHLAGFCIFVLTLIAGTSVVDPRLLREPEEEFKCFASNAFERKQGKPGNSTAGHSCLEAEFPQVRRAQET